MPSIDKPPQEPIPIIPAIDNEPTWSESLSNVAETISKAPAGQQLAIGGLSGWCIGYLFMKVGRTVAITVGGGLILLHIASYNGYVQVNWPKADSQMKRWRQKFAREFGIAKDPSTADKAIQFVKDHAYLAGGLVGGFFLGVGSA